MNAAPDQNAMMPPVLNTIARSAKRCAELHQVIILQPPAKPVTHGTVPAALLIQPVPLVTLGAARLALATLPPLLNKRKFGIHLGSARRYALMQIRHALISLNNIAL